MTMDTIIQMCLLHLQWIKGICFRDKKREGEKEVRLLQQCKKLLKLIRLQMLLLRFSPPYNTLSVNLRV